MPARSKVILTISSCRRDRFYDSTLPIAAGRGLDADLCTVRVWEAVGFLLIEPFVFMLGASMVAHAHGYANDADRLEAEGVAFQERVCWLYNFCKMSRACKSCRCGMEADDTYSSAVSRSYSWYL